MRECTLLRDLTSFPGAKVPSHQQVVKARDTNELEQFRNDLLDHAFLHVVTLQTSPNLVQEIEDIVHAICWLGVWIEQAVEQSTASVSSGETGE